MADIRPSNPSNTVWRFIPRTRRSGKRSAPARRAAYVRALAAWMLACVAIFGYSAQAEAQTAVPSTPVLTAAKDVDNPYTWINLSWTESTPSPGGMLHAYYIQVSDDGMDNSWDNLAERSPGVTTYLDTGLTPGATTWYRVRASETKLVDSDFIVQYSDWSVAHVTTADAIAPGAPASLSAEVGDGQVVLTWTAPSSDGGRPIKDYEYRYYETGMPPLDPSSSAGTDFTETVGTLINGTEYTFELWAKNIVGSGSAASVTATPSAPTTRSTPVVQDTPAPIADAGANRTIAQGEEITLDGSASADPVGGTVTYQWTYTGDRTDITVMDAETATPTVTAPTGLTADVVLTFSLVVTDEAGSSSAADTVEITVTSQVVRMDSTEALTFHPKTGEEVWLSDGTTVTLQVLPEGRSAPAGLALTLPFNTFTGEEATLTFDVDPAGSAAFRLGMTVVDIDLTGGALPAGETATVCLPAAESQAMLHRYDEETGSWQTLENSRSETRNGVAVVCAETDDFSVFGAFPPVLSEAERAAVTKAWLARFGRTVAGQAMDMIGARLTRVSPGSSHLTLGGQTINLSAARRSLSANGGSDLPGADGHARWPGGHPSGRGEFRPSGRELSAGDFLLGSSFSLSATANEDGSGPRWTAWGRGATTRFDGDDGSLSVNGRVSTGTLGTDYESGRLLAGLAVAHSRGGGDFDARHDKRGEMTAWLTSVYPYLRYAVHERVSVWGLFGYGRGELSLDEEEAENRIETDLAMRMGAVGVRGALLPATGGGVNLAIKSDFFMVEMESEEATELPAVEADARRVRLLLEVSRAMAMGTEEEVTPSVEVGVRHDGGDAERGSGVELGGGLRYTHFGWRLTSELTARALLAHEEKSYDEWGIGGSVRLLPDSAGRGLSFGLNSSWGASASGAEQLWAQQSAASLAATDPTRPSGRLNAELGYGVRALDGRGLLTPYAGVTLSEGGAQASRLGTRFSFDETFSLSLEGTRLERADTVTEHGVLLRGVMRW